MKILKNEFTSRSLSPILSTINSVEFHTITIKKMAKFTLITEPLECMVHWNWIIVVWFFSPNPAQNKMKKKTTTKITSQFHTFRFVILLLRCFCFAFHLEEFIKCICFSHAIYTCIQPVIWMFVLESFGKWKCLKVNYIITTGIQFSRLCLLKPILFI